jgi:hypothetical protein
MKMAINESMAPRHLHESEKNENENKESGIIEKPKNEKNIGG